MCHNHMQSATEFENMLVHELIHAFDHCRATDLDWGNCRHHACSEVGGARARPPTPRVAQAVRVQVRAANLSGDCSFLQEALRGNWGVSGQHQVCVRRRAELSVAMNPACAKPGEARAAVSACFDACLADTAPFERIP